MYNISLAKLSVEMHKIHVLQNIGILYFELLAGLGVILNY
jgi:hypothetical protein